MSRATLFIRRNGQFGASYGGVQDTGYDIREDSGAFTVFDHDGEAIAENVSRFDAETAIARDWDAAMAPGARP